MGRNISTGGLKSAAYCADGNRKEGIPHDQFDQQRSSRATPTPSPSARQKAPQSKPQPTVTDTVHLTGGKAILQETLETSVQTAQEARGGDVQAMRLQPKQASARAPGK